jgi:hypothetical protein
MRSSRSSWAFKSWSGETVAGCAQTPVGHLGLVDHEAGGVLVELARLETGGIARGAVDVRDGPAASADRVMVVVADA